MRHEEDSPDLWGLHQGLGGRRNLGLSHMGKSTKGSRQINNYLGFWGVWRLLYFVLKEGKSLGKEGNGAKIGNIKICSEITANKTSFQLVDQLST